MDWSSLSEAAPRAPEARSEMESLPLRRVSKNKGTIERDGCLRDVALGLLLVGLLGCLGGLTLDGLGAKVGQYIAAYRQE